MPEHYAEHKSAYKHNWIELLITSRRKSCA
jgi:hypothetical protein